MRETQQPIPRPEAERKSPDRVTGPGSRNLELSAHSADISIIEIGRDSHLRDLEQLLRQFPVVVILGARQIGKTTLARQSSDRRSGPVTFFDLERTEDRAALQDPQLALGRCEVWWSWTRSNGNPSYSSRYAFWPTGRASSPVSWSCEDLARTAVAG